MNNLYFTVTNILNDLGMNPKLKGYAYAREAIIMCKDDAGRCMKITKEVYPAVAEKFNTTALRVERGIRHAVTTSFDKYIDHMHTTIFGNIVHPDSGKVSNSDFIYAIVEYLNIIGLEDSNEG